MTLEQQYQMLLNNRKIQSNDILIGKKMMAYEYFRNLTKVKNLQKNLSNGLSLYYSPLRQIHGSNMVCWPIGNDNEIYVDEEFALNNKVVTNIQLQHEVLHCLVNKINGEQIFFGYLYDGSGKSNYIGINEAVTQIFTEDIIELRLGQKIDYLFFVKNIMRVMKVLFGEELLASQYLNNDLSFTEQFDKITDYKFEPFAIYMNKVYYLDKEKRYHSLTEEQQKELSKMKESLLNFTSKLIYKFYQNDSNIINKICNELQDEFFQNMLNINNIEPSSFNNRAK